VDPLKARPAVEVTIEAQNESNAVTFHDRNMHCVSGGRVGHAYQNLINLFLRDCAAQKRRPVIQWPQEATKRRAER
jgi:hypothetical protein